MKHGSLFSGIGGFDLAAEWMGWENIFHCEWNTFGQKVLKIVLDPFVGSGTTGIACKLEGFNFVGMEQDPEYAKIAEGRINNFVPENEDLPEQKSNELTQG